MSSLPRKSPSCSYSAVDSTMSENMIVTVPSSDARARTSGVCDSADAATLSRAASRASPFDSIRAPQIFRREVAAHRGHEVNTFGDSFMIAFSSVRRAVLCAIALQRGFAAYCDSHPDLPIRVRIGLHVGEAVRESTDFFGKTVILAARISALAQGGQILVSSTLHDVAASAGDLRFAPAGERALKGLAGTHRLFELVW
jgi:class 3 adenylate cyclase